MRPVISFVVPVRNDADRLLTCLRSIVADASGVDAEVIVADNGSTDESVRVAEANGATVVSLPARSVAGVRNDAAAGARGELLAFVDADQELRPGWIRAAIEVLADPEVWAAGADYHPPSSSNWVQRMYDRLRDHPAQPKVVEWIPSGNLVVRRSVFDALNGFDAELESCEDVDFCQRLRKAGGRIVSAPALYSVHFGDPRTLVGLFRSELWRGRDNLRVSLRQPTLRSAPSVIIPLANLAALAAMTVGVATLAHRGGRIALSGLVVLGVSTSLRGLRLLFRAREGRWSPRVWLEAWLVAATYELARALALVSRSTHSLRRKADS